jgi:hypothetical protein
MEDNIFDYAVVGTGVSSLGILKKILHKNRKILIIESANKPIKKNFINPTFCEENLPVPIKNSKIEKPHIKILNYKTLGGNTNFWGGYCCRFEKKDFSNWPIRFSQIEKFYSEAEKIFNIKQKNNYKKKSSLLIKKNKDLQINVQNSSIAKENSKIFNTGRAITALIKKYKKKITFDELIKFNIKKNIYILHLKSQKNILCKKLILCTGPYNTEKIINNSIKNVKFAKLLQAQSFIFPVFMLKNITKKLDLQIIQNRSKKLNEFYLEMKKNSQILKTTIKHRFKYLNHFIPSFIINRVAVIWGFLPSRYSFNYTVDRNKNVCIDIKNSIKKNNAKNYVKNIIKILEKNLFIKGFISSVKFNQFARSYHVGCNIPMFKKKKPFLTTKINGEVNHKLLKNLYICGSSLFVSLPSKSFGLTLLANALRIGTIMRKNSFNDKKFY